MEHVLEAANVTTHVAVPGIEISRRVRPGGEDVYIVINYNSTPCAVHMPWPSFEHLKGIHLDPDFEMVEYGVSVLTPSKK
jgi:hypothetical protein